MAFNSSISEVLRQLRQRRVSTGIETPANITTSLFRGAIDAELARSNEAERIKLANEGLDLQREQQKSADAAAKLSGMGQIGTSAALGGLLFKDQIKGGLGKVGGLISGSTADVTGELITSDFAGALNFGSTQAGFDSTLFGTDTALGSTGAVAGETGTAAGLGTIAGSGALGGGLGSLGGGILGKSLGGETGEKVGSITGGVLGGATTGFLTGGPFGALVGGIIGAGEGALSSTVICTELCNQGFIPKEVLILDTEYANRNIGYQTYVGYTVWAKYVVKLMQKSKIITYLLVPVGRSWSYEMASRISPKYKGNLTGKLLLKFGAPICNIIGGVYGKLFRVCRQI